MKKMRQLTCLLAVAVLVLVFAGCKGETPTAPPPTTPGGQTGGGTPPVSTADVALTVSKSDPQVDSTVTVTATVTQNGQPVPNGTAVEFRTNLGTFTEANAQVMIKTTTSGVATATLTSSAAGPATVTATVASVAKTAVVTFQLKPTTPQPPDVTPTISGVSPTLIPPGGGQLVTITGTNFVAPVKVLFDFGAGTTPKEALVVSTSATQIQVLSPAIDLGAGQQANATIIVINALGTANEARITSSTSITFQNTTLTPKITTVSPASGPIDGGTKVVIFGEGFQAPVQVFFGSAEAQVVNVIFSQITVLSPRASDTAPDGSGTVTGPVDVRVININSATNVTAAGIFRYTPKMVITAFGPGQGPSTGGTDVTIDGNGFNSPVAVSIGGVGAQVLKVTGTQILARTSPIALIGCADASGPVTVTNIDNGDTATAGTTQFFYRVSKPVITSVSNATLGGPISITVLNATGIPRLRLGTSTLNITGAVTDPNTGLTTFTAVVPTTLTLGTQACASLPGVNIPVATSFDVVYTSLTTSCTDTLSGGATIAPAAAPLLSTSPADFARFTSTFTPATFNTAVPPVLLTPASANGSTQTVAIGNAGTAPLTITSVTNSCGAGSGYTVIAPANGTIVNSCDSAQLRVSYTPTPAPAATATTYAPPPSTCSVTVATTGGTKTLTVTNQ